ncbi:MAG TPA: ABC transporter substrate-binding protein, partial [Chloroflexota bacterium]
MRTLPFLLLLCVALTACADSSAKVIVTPKPTTTTVQWGVVGVTDIPTLDPALASDSTSISLVSLIYGGLVRLDSGLHVRPDGAKRWTISRDGKVYTFFLRQNLRFPDGRRASAYTIAAALQRAMGSQGASGAAAAYLGLIAHGTTGKNHRQVRGILPLDATTLRITLIQPAAHFLAELAFPSSYVPDPAVQRMYGSSWTDHAAGFGPFFVRVWKHSRYLTLQRNPYYYGGLPSLKLIKFRFYDAESSALSAFQNGTLDLVSGLPVGDSLGARVAGATRIPALALDYLAFNTSRLPFFRTKAREAFAAEVTPSLVRGAMGSVAFPATQFLPRAFGLNVPLWRPTAVGRTYLLAARFTHPKRFPRITLVMLQDPNLYALAQKMAAGWKRALGVTVLLRQLNPSDYSAVLNARLFDLALIRWGADYPDPQDFLGTQLGTSPDNVTGWTRSAYQHEVLLADSYNPNDPRRLSFFAQAASSAAASVPILPLDQPAQTAVISPALKRVSLTALGTI